MSYQFERSWQHERERLAAIEGELDSCSIACLTALGVGPGWRCLEVGAGAGSIARWLSERVTPSGTVVATGELFPRVGFIVTTLTGTNRAVVRFYNGRGTGEQWIKEGKAATHWTRLSCHRFRANEVRLLLGVIAYNLGNLLRWLALPLAIQSWSLTSLQQRLFKTGGRLIRHARYFVLQLGRKLLDPAPVWSDPRAHRAARVASDLIEKPVRGESETRSGSIPAGVSLRSVVKGRGEGDSRAGIASNALHVFLGGSTIQQVATRRLGTVVAAESGIELEGA
jgi:hypothetical protein